VNLITVLLLPSPNVYYFTEEKSGIKALHILRKLAVHTSTMIYSKDGETSQ